MIKISIIVPVYNVEKYLHKCIESLLKQTLEEIEIICVNDGSTDNSLVILNEFSEQDNRIKILNKINSGYGHTMNQGMKIAQGKYIGIVESDDFVEPDMMRYLYEVMEKNELDVVMSDYYQFRTDSGFERKYVKNYSGCKYNQVFKAHDNQDIMLHNMIWHGVYKKSFLLSKEIWFNETPGAAYQDTAFYVKVWLTAERGMVVNKAFVNYRIDNVNSSVNNPGKVFSVCDEFKEIDSFIEKKNIGKFFDKVLFLKKFRTYVWNYHRLGIAFQYAFLLRASDEFRKNIQEDKGITALLNEKEKLVLGQIVYNLQNYFMNTSREHSDNRLSLYESMNPSLNRELYKSGFLSYIKESENIIIYGAGKNAKLIEKYLVDNNFSHKIKSFAVSSLKDNPSKINNYEVKEISTLNNSDNNCVLVATRANYHMEIINLLVEKGFEKFILIDQLILDILLGSKVWKI